MRFPKSGRRIGPRLSHEAILKTWLLKFAVALIATFFGYGLPVDSACAQDWPVVQPRESTEAFAGAAAVDSAGVSPRNESANLGLLPSSEIQITPGLKFGVPDSSTADPSQTLQAPPERESAHAASMLSNVDYTAADQVVVDARFVQQWVEGATIVRLARGVVRVKQGTRSWETSEAVIWESIVGDQNVIECYFDGESEFRIDGQVSIGRDRFTVLRSQRVVALRGGNAVEESATHDPIVRRAAERRAKGRPSDPSVDQVQFLDDESGAEPFPPTLSAPRLPAPRDYVIPPALVPPSLAPGQFSTDELFPASFADRVTITPRNFEVPFHINSRTVPGTTPEEQIITVTRGVNVVIERPLEGDVLDLTSDSAVIWTAAAPGGGTGTDISLGPDTPFQVYLQGNIVLRQGDTVARASEAYFDRAEGRGMLLGAEVRTFVPTLRGDLRVRADTVRFQLLADQLQSVGGSDIEIFANNAWITASRFGKPTYRLQSGSLSLRQRAVGQTVDPATGQVRTVTQPWLISEKNQFLLGDFPVVATPYMSAPVEDFSVPLKRLSVSSDRVFGTQLLSRWDISDLFGIPTAPGIDWTLDLDYLSLRGPRVGSDWRYEFDHDLFGVRAHSFGEGAASFVHDDGVDNLGFGRRDLIVENSSRGAVVGRHRTRGPFGYSITGEVGYVSDFNFLEQFREYEWDTGKDAETLLEIRRQVDNTSWSILGRAQVNEFVNQTDWLPRLDVTTLSQPLFVLDSINSSLNWSQHSMVGYGQLNPSTAPPNLGTPGQFGVAYDPLPYVADVGGTVAMTRHQLTLPFDVGPVRVVPYAQGELAFWQEGLDGNDISRAYGTAGIRGSMMMAKFMPYVRSDIWGLNGLAHKMIFDFDYSISESTQNLEDIPQYNEFDDNAQERFRERYAMLTFGGAWPATADPRGYALRSGAGRSVTSPYHELVDDMNVLKLGWRHRLQTRSGPPQARRTRDWMTFDLEASFFPTADSITAEDNFGESIGLISGRYAWNVGERTSLLADALYDIFDLSQETWSVGVLTQRPGRGSLYLGYRQIGLGDLDSEIISLNYSYAMSEKWLGYYAFAYDIAERRGQGHSIGLTRIGRDFVWQTTFDYDESKDDIGLSIMVEPFIGARDADDIDSLLQARSRFNARAPQFR